MPKMRFTAAVVRAAKASKKPSDLTDERYPGLVLRVTPAGTRTWRLLTTRADGSKAWDTVGYATDPKRQAPGVPVLSLSEALDVYAAARNRHSDAPGRLEAKIVALERELEFARLEAGYGLTFGELVKKFLERYSSKHHSAKYAYNLRRMLARDPLPAWAELPADSIDRQRATALLQEVAERAPVHANRLLAGLRKIYRWGFRAGLLRSNPFIDFDRPSPERSRELVLDDDELRAVLHALEARKFPNPDKPDKHVVIRPIVADALLLLAVTLQRREEVAQVRWAALRDRTWWNLNPDETKAGRSHRVYLSPLAAAIIERQLPTRFAGPYVFPGRRTPHVHPSTLSHVFKAVREGLQAAGLVRREYRLHDLRRTGRTGLSRLDVDPHVGDRVLNHAVTGVRKHYDLYAWDERVQDALERWSRHLSSLREPARSAL